MLTAALSLGGFVDGLPPVKYAPGLSLLMIPLLGLGRLLGGDPVAPVWLLPPLLSAGSAVLLFEIARRLGQSAPRALFVALSYSVASFAVVYGTRLFSEG